MAVASHRESQRGLPRHRKLVCGDHSSGCDARDALITTRAIARYVTDGRPEVAVWSHDQAPKPPGCPTQWLRRDRAFGRDGGELADRCRGARRCPEVGSDVREKPHIAVWSPHQ